MVYAYIRLGTAGVGVGVDGSVGVDVVGVSRWLEIVMVVDDGVGVLSYGEIVPCVGVVVDGGVGVDVAGVIRRHRIGYCRDRRGS